MKIMKLLMVSLRCIWNKYYKNIKNKLIMKICDFNIVLFYLFIIKYYNFIVILKKRVRKLYSNIKM